MSMYPDLYDFAEFGDLGALEDVFLAFLAVYMLIGLISSIYSIVVYVLHSLGMYTIAKRRGIRNPWLAWIPVASMWTLGSISDQYQYVAKGKVTKRRKVILGLMIAVFVMAVVIGIALGVSIGVAAVTGAADQIVGPVLILILGYIALIAVAITLTVFQYIAYYDLFASCNPDNATVFLVLSIFFSFLLPFFVFASRNKDLGMPARREPAPQPVLPVMPAAEPATEENQEDLVQEEDFEPEE